MKEGRRTKVNSNKSKVPLIKEFESFLKQVDHLKAKLPLIKEFESFLKQVDHLKAVHKLYDLFYDKPKERYQAKTNYHFSCSETYGTLKVRFFKKGNTNLIEFRCEEKSIPSIITALKEYKKSIKKYADNYDKDVKSMRIIMTKM